MPDSITPIIETYTVDLASNNNFWFVTGIQGDGWATRYVDILLVKNGQSYEINKDTVNIMIRGTKPDNKQILNPCTIIDSNTIRVEITPQMAAVPGDGEYQITIADKKENRVLTSFPFLIKIFESTFDFGYVLSSDEFGILVEKINQVDRLEIDVVELIKEITVVINESNTQTELCKNATNAMTELNATIIADENQRISNENERQSNTATAITNAEIAISNAITATNNANSATDSANAATSAVQERIDEYDSLNVSQKVQDAINAINSANDAASQAQERINEYDSLNISTTIQNAVNVTNSANAATSAATTATENAIKATQDAIDAVNNIQSKLGIDDTQESISTTWSSSHTHEVILQEITDAVNDSKSLFLRYKIPSITILKDDWQNKKIYIKNNNITSDSIIDIYYSNSSLDLVDEFSIHYSQGNGYICLTSDFTAYDSIIIDAIMIENNSNQTIGQVSSTL